MPISEQDIVNQAFNANHKRITKIKQLNGTYPKQFKHFVTTTDSNHDSLVAKNELNREFDNVKKK